MALEPRPYQENAIQAILPWLENNDGNGLVVLATGLGKSMVQAEFIKRFCNMYPDTRIICATHVADLVQGNHDALKEQWPEADTGIYSAKLKRRDKKNRILFGMLQSIYNKAFKLQQCDILFIDEVQSVNPKQEGMWGQFIKDMLVINPYMRIVGMSATPYRMTSGNLVDGKLFHGIIYEYGLLEGINDGYLCEIIPKSMTTKIDLSQVSKRGGEYVLGELERAVDVDAITKAAVLELIQYGHDRKTWMIFCSGVDHCYHVCDEIRSHGISCEVVEGNTPQVERERIYAALKDGTLRSVCSMAVMTTGTNIPNIDLIGGLRPTGSPGLLVQMAGRGTRPVYASGMPLGTTDQRLEALYKGPKRNCLYLDWANNLSQHGPLDKIRGKDKIKSDGGIPPMKTCEFCASVVFAGVRICPDCGAAFPEPEIKINAVSANVAVLSTQKVYEWYDIEDVTYARNAKEGKTPSMRVDYYIGVYERISEWICFEHNGYPRDKAVAWWTARSDLPVPSTVNEALKIVDSFDKPNRIFAYNPPGRVDFPDIKEYSFKPPISHSFVDEEDDLYAWTKSEQPLLESPSESEEVELPW